MRHSLGNRSAQRVVDAARDLMRGKSPHRPLGAKAVQAQQGISHSLHPNVRHTIRRQSRRRATHRDPSDKADRPRPRSHTLACPHKTKGCPSTTKEPAPRHQGLRLGSGDLSHSQINMRQKTDKKLQATPKEYRRTNPHAPVFVLLDKITPPR